MTLSLLKTLLRHMLQGKSLRLLLLSLLIATASITAISIFIERIDATLSSEAAEFIAADAKIQGSLALDISWYHKAAEQDLETAQTQTFSAMLFAPNEAMQLAQVKAASSTYPLRGAVEVKRGDTLTRGQGPQKGALWLAPRLAEQLALNLGDAVTLGEATLMFDGIIIKEPDSVQSAFGVAPRAMIHLSDVAATKAIQPGSRATYALLLAGDSKNIDAFRDHVGNDLGEHHRWLSPEEASAAFGSALSRAQRFLLLAGSMSVLLASVAIALAAHQFAQHQHTQVALLKTFGFTPKRILHLYIVLLAIIGMCGCFLGCAVGWGLHHGIVAALHNVLPDNLASASYRPFRIGILTSFIALCAFAAPPILALRQIAPAQILRNDSAKGLSSMISLSIGLLATALLIVLYSQDLSISIVLLTVLFACVIVCALLAFVLLRATRRLQATLSGHWRIGIANLQRQKHFTALQIFVFASVMLLLAVLMQLRTSLVDQWQTNLEQTPNHFVFNIFNDELEALRTRFSDSTATVSDFYPMARGRVLSINDIPLKERIIPQKQRTNYERELNLTWSKQLGDDNSLIEGSWWPDTPSETMMVSAEADYARGLGLELGDTLVFSVAGAQFSATLSSIREVTWDSMNPNFYMIFDRPFANDFASNWITSFYLPEDNKHFVNNLLRDYPTLSLIELSETIKAVQGLINQLLRAIEFILGLVLAASILVLLTSIQASMQERQRENALLRSFGASRGFIQKVVVTEFASIGLLAGVFACIGAEACLYFVQTKLFKFDATFHWSMWLVMPWLTAVFIAGIGYLATLKTINVPPLQALRAP